jgi:hypothetical protein
MALIVAVASLRARVHSNSERVGGKADDDDNDFIVVGEGKR